MHWLTVPLMFIKSRAARALLNSGYVNSFKEDAWDMSEILTKSMARNIFYGGSLFFILLFLGLTLHTTRELPQRDHRENLTEQVARGKLIWEQNNCIGCHTLLGEGAYFAPELGNVYVRRGGDASGGLFIKAWM